jgi:hypothetical protein
MIDKTMNWTAPLGWTPSYGDYMKGQSATRGGEEVNFKGPAFYNSALSITRSVSFFKILWMRLRFISLHPNWDTPLPSCLFGSFYLKQPKIKHGVLTRMNRNRAVAVA